MDAKDREHIKRLVDEAPPLREEQITILRELLSGREVETHQEVSRRAIRSRWDAMTPEQRRAATAPARAARAAKRAQNAEGGDRHAA